jgi:hypothetical protein
MGSHTRSDVVISPAGSDFIDSSQKWLTVLDASDYVSVPQWIEASATIVQNTGQVSEQRFRFHVEIVAVGFLVSSGNMKSKSCKMREKQNYSHFLFDYLLQVLEIGVIAGSTEKHVIVDFHQSFAIAESSHISIRAKQISGHHHASIVNDGENGSASSHRLPALNMKRLVKVKTGQSLSFPY